MSPRAERKFDVVLFDLLTALLDSWTLWNIVAGSPEDGRKWRAAYLRRTYETGAYRPYETLVAEAAAEVGLFTDPGGAARRSLRRARALAGGSRSARRAAPRRDGAGRRHELLRETRGQGDRCTGIEFDVAVTAERAGFYKPDARPYEMALDELGIAPGRCLFVAGSAYDLFGTSKVGLPTYWHDRIGMTPPRNAPEPIAHHRSLYPLLELVRAVG